MGPVAAVMGVVSGIGGRAGERPRVPVPGLKTEKGGGRRELAGSHPARINQRDLMILNGWRGVALPGVRAGHVVCASHERGASHIVCGKPASR